jgi:hypothetical protein
MGVPPVGPSSGWEELPRSDVKIGAHRNRRSPRSRVSTYRIAGSRAGLGLWQPEPPAAPRSGGRGSVRGRAWLSIRKGRQNWGPLCHRNGGPTLQTAAQNRRRRPQIGEGGTTFVSDWARKSEHTGAYPRCRMRAPSCAEAPRSLFSSARVGSVSVRTTIEPARSSRGQRHSRRP